MSSSPEKGKNEENTQDTDKDITGQNRNPAQQGNQPGQPKQTDDQSGQQRGRE